MHLVAADYARHGRAQFELQSANCRAGFCTEGSIDSAAVITQTAESSLNRSAVDIVHLSFVTYLRSDFPGPRTQC